MDHTKHKCQYRFPVSFFLTSSVRVRKIAGFRKFTIFSIKWSQCFLQISKKLSDCKTLFYVKKCYSCSTLSPSGAAAGLMVALILKLTFNLPQSSENQSCKRCLTIFEMRSQYMEKAPSPWRKCVLTWRIYYGILHYDASWAWNHNACLLYEKILMEPVIKSFQKLQSMNS